MQESPFLLENIEKELEKARELIKLNQEVPKLRIKNNKELILEKWNQLVEKIEREKEDRRVYGGFQKNYITGKKPFSSTPLEDLKPIELNQLQLPKHHLCHYLSCQTISEPISDLKTIVLIKDSLDNIETLFIHNFYGRLPVGTTLIIKEPYLCYVDLEENIGICCYSPSDIIFLEENQDLENTISDLEANLKKKIRTNSEEPNSELSDGWEKLEAPRVYDLDYLYEENAKNKWQKFDLPEYIGPVEVREISGKGKGLIAVENIPKGTLIVVSKAFSWTITSDYQSSLFVGYNLLNFRFNRSSSLQNITDTMLELKKNSHKAKELYALYAGEGYTRNEEVHEGVIDPGRIEGICTYNQFSSEQGMQWEEKEFEKVDTGLWIFPSYINHSCLENTSRTYFGDIMFIRTITDLQKGDEITLSYVDPMFSYQDRAEKLNLYGFACECHLCELDRADPFLTVREKMLDELPEIESLITSGKFQKAKNRLHPLVKKIRRTLSTRSDLKIRLFHPIYLLAVVYRNLGEMEKNLEFYRQAEKYLKEGIGILEETLIFNLVPKIYRELMEVYERLDEEEKARKVAEEAFEMYRIKTGFEKELFVKAFPEFNKFL